ncbi:hypothetical protein GPJ56_007716 [Histomonas meleagridis]|uniref:uncharacterized protein n=1 Tax=Histomonas meleagridis TaxID=135588 RepID=UPI0035594681|nr:hypothetical protein GPJ56_007716 [Histomonas meleagridis]KAH0801542.1 hypothetical protein GO595_005678 [Histomonas meleagridis]
MRMHTTENFSSETTLQAANDLPFAQSIPSQADFSDKIIPKELMTTFLRPEIDKEIIYSLYQIYNSLEPQDQQANLDEKWYSNLLLHLCRVWKSTISQTPETDFVTAVNCLLSLDDSLIEEFKLQLDTNLTFFFEQREDCSQLSDTFSFDSFVKYFIRYGCTTDLLQTLKEITYFDQSGFEPLYFPLTSSDIKAKFVGWFSPYHRNDHLIPNPGDWICNPSNKINVFSLHCRQEDDTIISIHIYHNPTEDDQNRRYSVNFKDGVKTSPTLDIMFRDILSLRYTNTRPNTHAENSRGYEKYADVIVNKNKENQQTEQQQNEHEEDKFASGSQITDSQFLPFMQFSGTQNSQNGFGPFDSQSTFF